MSDPKPRLSTFHLALPDQIIVADKGGELVGLSGKSILTQISLIDEQLSLDIEVLRKFSMRGCFRQSHVFGEECFAVLKLGIANGSSTGPFLLLVSMVQLVSSKIRQTIISPCSNGWRSTSLDQKINLGYLYLVSLGVSCLINRYRVQIE